MTDLHHTKTLPSSQIVSTNWVVCVCQSSKSHSQLFFKHWGWRSCESCRCYFNKKFRLIPICTLPPKIKTLLILLGKFIVELSWAKFKSSLDYFSSQNGDELLRVSSKNCSHSPHHISSYRNRTHFTLTCVNRNGTTLTSMQSNRLDWSTLIVTYHNRTVWNEYIRRYKRSLTQKIRGTLISLMHATLVLSWYCFPKTNSLFSTLSKHHVLTFFSQISCCKMWCENVSTWFSGILCQLIYHIASCPWVISAMEIPFTLYALSESSLVLIPIGIRPFW